MIARLIGGVVAVIAEEMLRSIVRLVVGIVLLFMVLLFMVLYGLALVESGFDALGALGLVGEMIRGFFGI